MAHEAAEAMSDAVPDGTIIELNLDDEAGPTVWEGDVIEGSGAKHEVQIDAADGSVRRDDTGH
ncbi:PepSY domain-containing protein [Microbacterium sp.]|uniref:PepSY domain-containing protein n=1 Tax=Microbacterium sp. TaxID=51671 RepID=UPI003F95A03F